jgi:hypothetical protein
MAQVGRVPSGTICWIFPCWLKSIGHANTHSLSLPR